MAWIAESWGDPTELIEYNTWKFYIERDGLFNQYTYNIYGLEKPEVLTWNTESGGDPAVGVQDVARDAAPHTRDRWAN